MLRTRSLQRCALSSHPRVPLRQAPPDFGDVELPRAATMAAVLAELDAAIADDELTECAAGGEDVGGEHLGGELLMDEKEDGSRHGAAAGTDDGWQIVIGRVIAATTLRDVRADLVEFIAKSRQCEPTAPRFVRKQKKSENAPNEWNCLQVEIKQAREAFMHDKGCCAPSSSSRVGAVAVAVVAGRAAQT